jgi:tyrosyl-tRNA synthetase
VELTPGTGSVRAMNPATNPLDLLRARGFVQDVTDEAGLRERFDAGTVTFYVGFDPTGSSLHAGHLLGMMAMSWLQRLGHRPIALAGGATGRIGDPTGRDVERELLDETTLARNLAAIEAQLGLVLDLDDDRSRPSSGMLVDNYSWTRDVTLLEFLRDVGVNASVNQMIARDSVKRRLEEREQGLTYAEFSYQLLQAFDFAHLYATHDCVLQGGGPISGATSSPGSTWSAVVTAGRPTGSCGRCSPPRMARSSASRRATPSGSTRR